MKVSMIAAMGRNRVIGTGCGIPWILPRDREHFRDYTAGKALLIGRRTFAEMSGWFRDHRPVVLTGTPEAVGAGAWAVVSSVADAVRVAREAGEPELVVCGGAATYEAALPHADEIVLTLVDLEPDGRARFPELPGNAWTIVHTTSHPADAENPASMEIRTLLRRPSGAR